ncbi:hypothetical protein [Lysobacter gummosus]|uniref:hypothetical protein n=1 Tax=Lysobacter gummosus TaxID=262324 RepID=UPI00364199DE
MQLMEAPIAGGHGPREEALIYVARRDASLRSARSAHDSHDGCCTSNQAIQPGQQRRPLLAGRVCACRVA